MPNAIGYYSPEFYANETLIHLRKVLGMAQRVHTGFDEERRTFGLGEYINIRTPSTFVAQEGSITVQDILTKTTQIRLNRYPEVRFAVPDNEYAYTGERLISDHIAPAAYALADHLDQALIALYKDIPWTYDYGTATDHTVVTGMYGVAFGNQAPMMDPNWHLQVDGTLQMGFQNSDMFKSASLAGEGNNETLFNGSLGRRYNIEIYANQNATTAATHTVGTVISGADQAGALTANLAAGATTLAIGSLGATETLKAGDTFSIAGNTQRYAVTADVTMVGGAANVSFTPAAAQAYSSGAVVTFYVQATGAVQQMLYNRNAFALAYAQLPTNLEGTAVSVATDPVTGMSVRARRWTDNDTKQQLVGLDMLYGCKTLNPNLAVRGWT